jgi:phosphoglycerate dehydrogenase-like enzyme
MTNEDGPDIVVLRGQNHGTSLDRLASELRDRLDSHDIRAARTPEEERELLKDAPIAIGLTISKDLLAEATDLRWFACMASGYGHLPLNELRARDICVTNASGIHAPNIAEYVVGNILVFTRRLHEGWQRGQRREWRHFQARELAGSTVTIVGLGAIGTAVANRLDGFDVETIGVRYTPSKGGPTDEVTGFEQSDIHTALARTEYLVVVSRLTDETRGLLSEKEFKTLPPEAVVINAARGPIIDTSALVSALRGGSIRGAALDVTDPEPLPGDHPLWNLKNVFITPHNAGHSPKLWSRFGDIVASNVQRVEDTGTYRDLRNQILP